MSQPVIAWKARRTEYCTPIQGMKVSDFMDGKVLLLLGRACLHPQLVALHAGVVKQSTLGQIRNGNLLLKNNRLRTWSAYSLLYCLLYTQMNYDHVSEIVI